MNVKVGLSPVTLSKTSCFSAFKQIRALSMLVFRDVTPFRIVRR
jgi:hypothetical protein